MVVPDSKVGPTDAAQPGRREPVKEIRMNTTSTKPESGLVVSRRAITAARARSAQPSDGGGTGRSDTNDNQAG